MALETNKKWMEKRYFTMPEKKLILQVW